MRAIPGRSRKSTLDACDPRKKPKEHAGCVRSQEGAGRARWMRAIPGRSRKSTQDACDPRKRREGVGRSGREDGDPLRFVRLGKAGSCSGIFAIIRALQFVLDLYPDFKGPFAEPSIP